MFSRWPQSFRLAPGCNPAVIVGGLSRQPEIAVLSIPVPCEGDRHGSREQHRRLHCRSGWTWSRCTGGRHDQSSSSVSYGLDQLHFETWGQLRAASPESQTRIVAVRVCSDGSHTAMRRCASLINSTRLPQCHSSFWLWPSRAFSQRLPLFAIWNDLVPGYDSDFELRTPHSREIHSRM